MKRSMILTIPGPDFKGTIGTLTRSFDNEQALGNFAVCRVRVNGKRFNRVSCERDLLVSPPLPETHPDYYDYGENRKQGDLWRACVSVLYKQYVQACNRESLNAHDRHMWEVHGFPKGPIG